MQKHFKGVPVKPGRPFFMKLVNPDSREFPVRRRAQAGIAGLMLTPEALVADIREDNKQAAAAGGHSGPPGGMSEMY